MRILQVMKWLSSKADTGGKIRSFWLGQALASFAQVDAVGFSFPGEKVNGQKEHLCQYNQLYAFPVQRTTLNSFNFLSGVARGLSLRSARFFDPNYGRFIEKILRENNYDAIQVEELPMMSNLGSLFQNFPVIYSSHNVESQLSPMMFRHRNPVLRLLKKMERKRTAAEERKALSESRACIAVSEKDRRALQRLFPEGKTPIYVLPNCAHDRFQPSSSGISGRRIISVGCFGWYPNEEGMIWFIKKVLPGLRKQLPRLDLAVVGSQISRSLVRKFKQKSIQVYSDVPDILPFLQGARLLIVPLRIGGGTRIKIIEAWAAGLPVVSTSIGADGLTCKPGLDILIADDPIQFAGAIHRILTEDDLYKKLRLEGLNNAKNLRWSGLAAPLKEIYQNCGIKS